MINYTEKGNGLHLAIFKAGYLLSNEDGAWVASDLQGNRSPEIDAAVQSIIGNYDPLPEAKAEAADRVNVSAGKVRAKYATDIPFQTEAYNSKLADAQAFKAAGYPEVDLANYPYTNARSVRQVITGQAAADFIIDIAANWDMLMFAIENKRDAANEQIEALTDWALCAPTADAIVAEFEAM